MVPKTKKQNNNKKNSRSSKVIMVLKETEEWLKVQSGLETVKKGAGHNL